MKKLYTYDVVVGGDHVVSTTTTRSDARDIKRFEQHYEEDVKIIQRVYKLTEEKVIR